MAECAGSVEIGAQYADCAHCKSLLPGAAPAAAAAPVSPKAAAATNGTTAGEHKSSPAAAPAPAPAAVDYAAKLAEKLRHVESTVAAAEHVVVAEGAPAAVEGAAAAADSKVDAKSDVKVAEPETKHAPAPEESLSPTARSYADRLRERLTRAAEVVAAADQKAAAAAAAAVVVTPSARSAAASPRSTKASDAPAVAAKRIVLGPTVRDAVTRLTNGFEVLVYAVTEEHKVCTRRTYTVWFSLSERALCWAAGSAKLLVASQRLPVSELTHIYFGAQTKAFEFAQSAVGGSAAINSGLCLSLLTPKATLDIEALNKQDFRAFLACLNTVLESYGKLTFMERSSASADAETRRFRIVPAADLDDDPLQLTAAGSVASVGPAPLTAANVGGLPNVWIAPGSTRMVFPANVGTHGFRAVSGQPLNTDITALSRSAVPFLNPHLNELQGRGGPLRIHLDPNGLTEADALRGHDGSDVILRESAAALAGDETLYVEDADSDSDSEDDPVRASTTGGASAGRAAAAPATNSVAALLPPMPRIVDAPAPAAAAAAKPAPPTAAGAPGAVVAQGVTVKRTDALAGALMQGLVWKAAGVFKRWESRYVALVGRYFFKYDTPSAPLGATLGHPLPLDLCTFEACGEISANVADPTKGPAFLFRVTYKPANGPVRDWVLGVSSDAIRQHWLKALGIAKPLIAAKVAGKRAWTEHDVVANTVAALAYQTH